MPLTEFTLLALVSLFAISNPFSVIPAFLAITTGVSDRERVRTARMGCLVAAGVLTFFTLAGQFLFSSLGITIAAFQIAGGALLFAIGFDMLRSSDAPKRLTEEEHRSAQEKDDVAITPLGVPLLCGPGAISTVIILQSQAVGAIQYVILLLSVPLVYLASYLVLRVAVSGAGWINPIFLRIVRRVMGLLFAAIAVQFIVNGIAALPFVARASQG